MKTIELGGNSDHTFASLDWSAWNKIVLSRSVSVSGNHTEMNLLEVPRLLTVDDSNHAVEFRVAALVLVVHEGKFEVRSVLDLLLRVGAVVKLADYINASAVFDREFVRISSCAAVVLR